MLNCGFEKYGEMLKFIRNGARYTKQINSLITNVLCTLKRLPIITETKSFTINRIFVNDVQLKRFGKYDFPYLKILYPLRRDADLANF